MNNLKLKALRLGVGLSVAEASELVNVNKRTFQYWEIGRSAVPDDVQVFFNHLAFEVKKVLDFMRQDIKYYNGEHGLIEDVNEDFKSKLILPYFKDFEQFKEVTKCPLVQFWRVYQSVINHLVITDFLQNLDDSAEIPSHFIVNKWFSDYTHHQTERWEYDFEKNEWY